MQAFSSAKILVEFIPQASSAAGLGIIPHSELKNKFTTLAFMYRPMILENGNELKI